jgi:hypothetical protein
VVINLLLYENIMYKRPSILVGTETKLGARQKITAQIEELETLSPNCAKYDVIHTLLSGMSRLFLILRSFSVYMYTLVF